MSVARLDRLHRMQLGWNIFEIGTDVHVIPVQDVVFHTETDDCPCNPAIENPIGPDEKPTPWRLLSHAAWDGRE